MRALPLALTCLLTASPALAADAAWPQFRGPRSSGVAADDPRLPERWSATENVRWRTDIPGAGWSSPVVWGDHVFVTTAVAPQTTPARVREYGAGEVATTSPKQRWTVLDLDAKTGKVRWQRAVASAVPAQPLHLKNSLATETPVTDGERVYAYFSQAGLFALDFTGKVVWSRPMPAPRMRQGWGAGASPLLYHGRIYLQVDSEDASYLLALDAKTGKEVWKVDRERGSSWSTPFVWVNPVRTELVTVGPSTVRGYTLDGAELWRLSGLSSLSIPTPVAGSGLLYVSSGYKADPLRPVYAVRAGARGDISLPAGKLTNDYIEWANPTLAAYNPSPLVYQNIYYAVQDNAMISAHEAGNGKEIYGKQRMGAATGVSASPWAYNGKVFAISEDGETFVLQAGREFKLLGQNRLDEMTLATPAIADGSLFIRTASKLYRIGTTR